MNALRVARAALRARPAAMRVPIQPLQRRSYADAATDKARISTITEVPQSYSTNISCCADQAKLVPPSRGPIPPPRDAREALNTTDAVAC